MNPQLIVSHDGRVTFEPRSGPCVECGNDTTQTVFNFEWSDRFDFLHRNQCPSARRAL